MRCANLRKVHALLERRGFPAMLAPLLGSLAMSLITGVSIAVGAVTPAVLGRHFRTALPKKPTAAAPLLRDRRRSAAGCVKSPGRDPG
jgi:hypothetical protein